MEIRRATLDDAAACAAIYAPYALESNATFETEPPSVSEMTERMRKRLASHDWLVAVENGAVLGYAYASPFRERAAYDWAFETTIYLAPEAAGKGLGTALYTELLSRLTDRGFHTAIALVAIPNDASEALHRRMGFEAIGTFRHSGFKNGEWSDVRFYQKLLVEPSVEAPTPVQPAQPE